MEHIWEGKAEALAKQVNDLSGDYIRLGADLGRVKASEEKAWNEVAALRDMSGNWQGAERQAAAAKTRVWELERAHQTTWAERNAARDELSSAQSTIASLRQDLDKVSAERDDLKKLVED